MHSFNREQRLWVAWGLLCVGASVLLAAYGRHGMAEPELQVRWGIAVEYVRFMGLGLAAMVVIRRVGMAESRAMWPERLLALGTSLFSGTVGIESIAPEADWVIKFGMAAPIGGVLMAGSWLVFVFELIRNQRPSPS